MKKYNAGKGGLQRKAQTEEPQCPGIFKSRKNGDPWKQWPGLPPENLTCVPIPLLLHGLQALQQAVHLHFYVTQLPPDGIQVLGLDC